MACHCFQDEGGFCSFYMILNTQLSTSFSTLSVHQIPFFSPFQSHCGSVSPTLQATWAAGILSTLLFHLDGFSWLLWPH